MKNFKYLIALLMLASAISCSQSETEYWWTRGQPPAPSKLAKQMQDRLVVAQELSANSKTPIKNISKDISSGLSEVSNDLSKSQLDPSVKEKLTALGHKFQELEGKLTYTSRPAYGELSGQLRAYIGRVEQNEQVSQESFDLFVARTCSFLAGELEVISKL